MKKPIVFISHITEEKDLAISLKRYLENKFLKTIEVFVSSHEDSIGLGDDWLKSIKYSLANCNIEIILCSPLSVTKPWINFEAGGGWVKNIPVIPICHSGLEPGDLPIPLSSFQGGLIDSKEDLEKLFKKIASINDSEPPSIEDNSFTNFATNFQNKVKESILLKDTLSINNLLSGSIEQLKYAIYSSTTDIMMISGYGAIDMYSFEVVFNKLGNLYNPSLFTLGQEKVFKHYYRVINKMCDDVKFLLTHNSITIYPDLVDLLNNFLFKARNEDEWMNYFTIISGNVSVVNDEIEWIKTFDSVPKREIISNAVNYFLDYYDSLKFYQKWIFEYDYQISRVIH